nr:hypothetical protein BgiMline_008670 [Biomphalaria glabrata]
MISGSRGGPSAGSTIILKAINPGCWHARDDKLDEGHGHIVNCPTYLSCVLYRATHGLFQMTLGLDMKARDIDQSSASLVLGVQGAGEGERRN